MLPRLPFSSCVTTAMARPLPPVFSAASLSETSLLAASHVVGFRPALPSRTTGPSRLRAMTPQPAGHSRHTVENQDATPGTSCSFGTTSGRIVSLACWQPPLAAAAPDTVTILKKSRRFMAPLLSSMVADHAVERSVPRVLRVLLAVALDAPAHRQGRRRGPEAHQVQEVDRQRRSRVGRVGRHRLDGPVTSLALEARADVGLVREVRELRKLVHAYPRDRFLLRVVLGELLDLRLVGRGDLVAPHTALDGWQSGVF